MFYCLKTKMKSLPILQKTQEWDFCKYYPVIIAYKKTLSNSEILRKISPRPRPRNAEDAGKSTKLCGISGKRSFFNHLQQDWGIQTLEITFKKSHN